MHFVWRMISKLMRIMMKHYPIDNEQRTGNNTKCWYNLGYVKVLQEGVRYNYVKSNIIIFISFLFTVPFVVTVSLGVASAFECLDCSEVPVECDAESCVPTSCTTSVPCVGYCLIATFPDMTSSITTNGSDPSIQNINGMFACINETNPEIVGKKHCQVLNYVMDRLVLGYDQLVTWI